MAGLDLGLGDRQLYLLGFRYLVTGYIDMFVEASGSGANGLMRGGHGVDQGLPRAHTLDSARTHWTSVPQYVYPHDTQHPFSS